MIQVPTGKDIVLLSKRSFLSPEVSLQILNLAETQDFLNRFDYTKKQLYVDCDEDSFLEVSPEERSFAKQLLWENGTLEVSKETFDSILDSMPPLSPFLAQDLTGKDLMLAWGKKESLIHAIESGNGTYFSRSRNGKWVKGEESGHFQKLKQIYVHSNPFFVQYITDQIGAACHTGYYSCFFRELGQNESVSFVYSNKVGESV
jgi:phosphoribosyl-AMP cyclohydrolase